MDTNPSSNNAGMIKATGGGRVPGALRYALSGRIMLCAIIILFSVVLLLLFLHFYVRWHVVRRAAGRARRLRRLIFSGESQAPAGSRALDPVILNSLPVLLFSIEAGDDDGMEECAVCLNEFEEGEKIRRLPRCGHSFHVDCIDMWFSSHANCPVCRAAVEAVSFTADSAQVPDLCSSCQGAEVINSPSSDSSAGVVVIEMPERLTESLSREAEPLGLGFGLVGEQALKWTSNRFLLIRRLLTRDILTIGADGSGPEPDLEGGEGATPPQATQSPAE